MRAEARRALLRWILAVAAVAAIAVSVAADREDRLRHLALECRAELCQASVDGGVPLSLTRPSPVAGRKLGLYAYAPWEQETAQSFRDLVIRTDRGLWVDSSLRSPSSVPAGLLRTGWRVDPTRGLTPRAEPGSRSMALFSQLDATDFRIEIVLVEPSDLGFVFHATDESSGTVVAVRPTFNDVLLFQVEEGDPVKALAVGPLEELTLGREGTRLAGLLGRILLASMVLVGLLRWLGARIDAHEFKLDRSIAFLRCSRPPRPLLVLMLILSVTLPALIALRGLGGVPHLADEVAYLFQAKIFAAGQIWAPAPAAGEFFQHEHILIEGSRWFAKYPPLFPALLSLGLLLGVPWLVNPLLAGLTAFVTYLLGRQIAGWQWGLVAWLLTLSSPFFLIMGGTLMSHPASALLVTLFIWLVLVAVERCSPAAALAAGLCLGLALFTRPYTALLAALVVAAQGVILWVRRPVLSRVFLPVAVGVSLLTAGFLFWNDVHASADEGSPHAYAAYHESDTLGFGPDKGQGWLKTWGTWGHTPAKALRSVDRFFSYTARYLLGWPLLLSFFLVVAHFLWGRPAPAAWLLLSLFGALVVGHMLYWATQHIGYGVRYWFAATPGLMVLSALGLRTLARDRGGAIVAALAVGLLVLANLGGYLPLRLQELPSYGGMTAALPREVERRGIDNGLVFVRTEGLLYNDGFFMNDPFLAKRPLFARDLGPRNVELQALYPELESYRWDGKLLTHLPSVGKGE